MRSGSAISFSNTFMAASAAAAAPSSSTMAQLDEVDLDGESECPLCMEQLDISDLNFKPCPCGYQICRFCWNHIKENLNGSCPACRKVYEDSAIEFTPLKPEDIKRLQVAQKQRAREKKDAEINSRKHLANVRVKQKTQAHIQGMTAKLANEDNIPLLKSHDWFGQHGRILKLFLAKRTNMPESMQSTIDTKNQPVNVYINYASQREAAACITACDGVWTPDGTHKLRAGWGTTKYCPAFLRGQRCHADNCMMAHEQGEEVDPVGGAPGPVTREEMSTLKHAMKEQEFREAQQRWSGPGSSRAALPPSASWAKLNAHPGSSSSPIGSSTPLPSSGNAKVMPSSSKPTSSSFSAARAHPLPAKPLSSESLSRQSSQGSTSRPGTARKASTSTEESLHPAQVPTTAVSGSSETPSSSTASLPPAPPGLPPPPGFGYAAPPGLTRATEPTALPIPSTSHAALDATEDLMAEPFSADAGSFTFNFKPGTRRSSTADSNRNKKTMSDLDIAPTGSSTLSDGLFSAADLLLSPPPDHFTMDEPSMWNSSSQFDPFADSSLLARDDPELRPKSSRFDFAKRGRGGLSGSTESLQGLARAAATPPPLDGPPGISSSMRGFPNGLLGPQRTASPLSLFGAPNHPVSAHLGPSAHTVNSPPPGFHTQVAQHDPWGAVSDAGRGGMSRATVTESFGSNRLSPNSLATANTSLPGLNTGNMSMASAALPSLGNAASQPLPPPPSGSGSMGTATPMPPGLANLARQPLPGNLASYPLPHATGRSAAPPPPGLTHPSQQQRNTSPTAHGNGSSELFSHLMSLANTSPLVSPSNATNGPSEFSDPAILNMSSAQRFPPNYQQQMDQFGYGQYYPQQRGGQAQAAYNPAMMRR